MLDRSGGSYSLAVTISDGETTVFSAEFETRKEYDKANRANLPGKKTTDTVEVSTENDQALTETVIEAGELAISVN